MQNGVGGQLVQLNPIDEKQTAEKFMERDRKATEEEINECYPEIDGRAWSALSTRKDHRLFVEQAELLQHLLVLGSYLRVFPPGDLGLLHGCAGVRGAGCAALDMSHAVGSKRKK
jgi:hypothetical protein